MTTHPNPAIMRRARNRVWMEAVNREQLVTATDHLLFQGAYPRRARAPLPVVEQTLLVRVPRRPRRPAAALAFGACLSLASALALLLGCA